MKLKIEELITDLLDKSLAPGQTLPMDVSYDSSKTVAASARDRIKDLTEQDLPELKTILLSNKNIDRRAEAYSLISSIAQKNNDSNLIHYLIEKLAFEKNKSFIGLRLSGITYSNLRLSSHSDIILDFAQNKKSHIRHSAIQVLGLYSSDLDRIESFLLQILNTSKDEYDLYYSCITLQKIGTEKSIESLKHVIRDNKKVDLLITGVYALGIIDGQNQVDFFLEMLNEKKDSFVKSILIELITEHADNRALDAVINRVKKILSRHRKINIHYGQDQYPEIVHALNYLLRFENDDKRIPKLLQWIIEIKMDFLDVTETDWVDKNIKCR